MKIQNQRTNGGRSSRGAYCRGVGQYARPDARGSIPVHLASERRRMV